MKYIREYNDIEWDNFDEEEFEPFDKLTLRGEYIKTEDSLEAFVCLKYLKNTLNKPIDIRSLRYSGNGLVFYKTRWTYVGLSTNPVHVSKFISFDTLKNKYKK